MAKDLKEYEVRIEKNVEAQMRDGVVLKADVARPKARGKFPVILHRTPYGKTVEDTRLARAGYVSIA